jgi:alanyl-tRNA synthetase
VRQAGSAVRPDKLRFDFTHPTALTAEERAEVEKRVNEEIFRNAPVVIFETPIEEARKLGAMMLFGEKYGDVVRVVSIPEYSTELCGGTHVRSTAEIGAFAILSESSVGSGARRIEAVTSGEAYALLRGAADEVDELRGELEKVRKESRRQKAAPTSGPEYVSYEAEAAGGVNVIVGQVAELSADELLDLSDQVKQREQPAAVVLASAEDGRVHLVANFDHTLEERGLDASKVIRAASAHVGGGGGGRPSMARAGGKDPEKLPEALAAAKALILETLS